MCIKSVLGPVVIASESLEDFFYFMTIALSGENHGIDLIDRLDALVIAYRIMTGKEAEDIDLDPRGTLPAQTEAELRTLVSAQMQFSFGHEYAHHLRGHTGGQAIAVAVGGGAESRVFNHSLEYDADFFALRNIQHALPPHRAVSKGAVHALVSLHLLSELLRLRKHTFSVSDSHPEPTDRLQKLIERMGAQRTGSELQSVAEQLLEESGRLLTLFPEFLSHQRPDLLTFYGSVYLRSYAGKQREDRVDF